MFAISINEIVLATIKLLIFMKGEDKYPADPRPITVDCRLRELTYPTDPRPVKDDCRPELLIYKSVPNPITVDVTSASKRVVLTYPEDPRPWTVDSRL